MKERKERKIQKREEKKTVKTQRGEELLLLCWRECERNNIELSSSWDPLIMRL